MLRSSTGHFFTFVVTGKEAKQVKKMTCSASGMLPGHKTSSSKGKQVHRKKNKLTEEKQAYRKKRQPEMMCQKVSHKMTDFNKPEISSHNKIITLGLQRKITKSD